VPSGVGSFHTAGKVQSVFMYTSASVPVFNSGYLWELEHGLGAKGGACLWVAFSL